MTSAVVNVVLFAGLTSVGYGCWLIFPPAAWIYGGMAAATLAVVMAHDR